MIIKFKKLHPKSVLPTKGSEGAAAYDLYASESVYIPVGETASVGTGLSMEIPKGWKGEIYSRSGLASQGVVVANAPGKIDCDYRGEIKILIRNERTEGLVGIKRGDRIAQFEISQTFSIEFEEVTTLSNTQRGEGSFGSTGV